MRNLWKVIIILLLVASIAAVIVLKNKENRSRRPQPAVDSITVSPAEVIQPQTNDSNNSPLVMTIEVVEPKKLPRLVELGADRCIPCKLMKPILRELDREYKGKLQVELYDVWKNPAHGRQHGIRVIPTQIFLDADGRELYRHEGYYSKKDILTKWKKLGFDFSK